MDEGVLCTILYAGGVLCTNGLVRQFLVVNVALDAVDGTDTPAVLLSSLTGLDFGGAQATHR